MLILTRIWQQMLLCVVASTTILVNAPFAFAEDVEPTHDHGVITLDEVVVTSAGSPEPLSKIASTVQVISAEEIRKAHNRSSVTQLLRERGVGFFQ